MTVAAVGSSTPSTREAALQLLAYCRARDWSGYDPYDGLNSRIFQRLPLRRFRLARLGLIQGLKRSPINFRALLGVPGGSNPKGTAVFLSALVRLRRVSVVTTDADVDALSSRLLDQKTAGCEGWGYNFDWQQRKQLVPRATPNIICTTFAGQALLDADDYHGDARFLDTCCGAGRFLRDRLYVERDGDAWFNYTPQDRSPVHNANLLGAAYLCRLGAVTGDPAWREPALRAARYTVARQQANGAWAYGETAIQGWVDNFHTGFNLCALRDIGRHADTREFEDAIRRGYGFYLDHFFEPDGAPKYYHNRRYPLDIHSAAQSMITLATLQAYDARSAELANRVCAWTLRHMRDSHGYFYYQKWRTHTNRIAYMRWSQAWMLLALSVLLQTAEERP